VTFLMIPKQLGCSNPIATDDPRFAILPSSLTVTNVRKYSLRVYPCERGSSTSDSSVIDLTGCQHRWVSVVRLDRVDQEVHIVKGCGIPCNIFVTRGKARLGATLRIMTTPGRSTSVVAAECDVDDLVDVSSNPSMSKRSIDHLHLPPGPGDVTVAAGLKVHHRLTPLLWVGFIALDVSWDIGPGEVPYLDTISFDLCSPDATAFFY
jgi:hypothetical protein